MPASSLDASLLRHFIPFNRLSPTILGELAAQTEILSVSPGQVVFRRDDDGPWVYFVLEGEVVCQQPDQAPRVVRAGSDEARHALSRARPRGCNAVAATPSRVFRIDEARLEAGLGLDQATAYEVFEYDGSDDPVWMMHILAQPAFRGVPAAHANAMFARFEALPCRAGDVVIRQDDPADAYYLIRTGHARVTRAAPGGAEQVLAVLGPGQGFGEEALLTGYPRNASVTMTSDGTLMRLAKADFEALLKAPLVRLVGREDARQLLEAGAQLVDVRLEDEYREGTLAGSVNLPLYLLRLKAASLDPAKPYILFCQHDQRSSAAAFLLAQRGFDVYVLSGGLSGLSPERPAA